MSARDNSRRACDACFIDDDPPTQPSSAFLVGLVEGARGTGRLCGKHIVQLEFTIRSAERKGASSQEDLARHAALVQRFKNPAS